MGSEKIPRWEIENQCDRVCRWNLDSNEAVLVAEKIKHQNKKQSQDMQELGQDTEGEKEESEEAELMRQLKINKSQLSITVFEPSCKKWSFLSLKSKRQGFWVL
jgi:hypothetical protein